MTVRMPIGRTAARQAMRTFRYEALKFVSFPVQMLGKSSKMVHLCSEIKSILRSISHQKSNVFTFDSSKVQYCIIDLAFLPVCPDTDVCALEIARLLSPKCHSEEEIDHVQQNVSSQVYMRFHLRLEHLQSSNVVQ